MPPKRRHHVFLFRHCVRSTPPTFKLYNETTKHEKEYDVRNFTSSPLPNWNVPEKWCTEEGMEIMKQTGNYVLDDIVSSVVVDNNNKDVSTTITKKLQVQFVSDASQRDIDTSFALYQGIYDALTTTITARNSKKTTKFTTVGLSDITNDPTLFEPLDGVNPFCEKNYSPERLSDDIKNRLHSIPPPQSNLSDTLLSLERIGGIGNSGSLTLIQPNSTFELSPNSNSFKIQGAINIVKLFAQIMFYSRASGVDPPFLPNATSGELYQFVEWIHWVSSVLRVDNVESATKGVVMTNAILESLENGHYNVKDSATRYLNDYDSSVSFFVGHDSDLDNVATALGIRWKLEPPYRSGADNIGEYTPTPPGASMHFEYDLESGIVELSYLYPVFPIEETTNITSNLGNGGSIVMKKTPLVFSPLFNDMSGAVQISQEGQSTLISPTISTNKRGSLIALRQRLLSTLNKFPEATECYYKATNQSHLLLMSGKKVGPSLFVNNSTINVSFLPLDLIVMLLLSSFLALKVYARRIKIKVKDP